MTGVGCLKSTPGACERRFGVKKERFGGSSPALVPPDGRQPQALQRGHDHVHVVVARPQNAAVGVEAGVGRQPGERKPKKKNLTG